MGLNEDWIIWEKKKNSYERYNSYSKISFGTAVVFAIGGIGPAIVVPTTNNLPIGATIGIIIGLIGLVVLAIVCGIIFRKIYLRDKAIVKKLERQYGVSTLNNKAMSEHSLNATLKAFSEASKAAVLKHHSSYTGGQTTSTSSYGGGSYYDSKGILRKRGESYYDYKGILRSPGEKYYDSKGNLRNPGENYYDGKGILRKPGEGYFDGSGNYQDK